VLVRSNISSSRPHDGVRSSRAADDGREPATAVGEVRLAELLGRLSLAFDIANDAPYGRGVRSVVLAVELGRRAGATTEELHDAFWLSLISYLGHAGQMDRVGAAAAPASDASMRLAELVGAEARIRSALTVEGFARAAHGVPTHLLQVARFFDVAQQRHGRAEAIALVQRQAGNDLDEQLAAVFIEEHEELLRTIDDSRTFDRFLEIEPGASVRADEHRVDDIARSLAILADLQCPLFIGHSTSVAALAERAAGHFGLGSDDTRSLRRAALLHDIGRLGVPSSIWMRPGPLDWGEMERVRLHAYYTERVLAPIRVLGPVAEIAASAHEHVDGSGYPQSRTGRSLLPAARILAAADVAIAMTEPRPHRPALAPDALTRELVAEVEAGRLDGSAVDAVLTSMGMNVRVVSRHTHGVSERELDVCRLIARGKMNKEIADVLGISLRTVQNHVAHIFDKLGVHSRSGVAVWLVENDFLQ
jgi:HD-GYP domain-containing protein (c-di-GMP phosphodiesterase class II)